jgi:hypothetical protein
MMADLSTQLEAVRTRNDLVQFIHTLLMDLQEHSEDWENPDLERYLGALAAWIDDMDGYFKNQNLPTPEQVDWILFGKMLMAARRYE